MNKARKSDIRIVSLLLRLWLWFNTTAAAAVAAAVWVGGCGCSIPEGDRIDSVIGVTICIGVAVVTAAVACGGV